MSVIVACILAYRSYSLFQAVDDEALGLICQDVHIEAQSLGLSYLKTEFVFCIHHIPLSTPHWFLRARWR